MDHHPHPTFPGTERVNLDDVLQKLRTLQKVLFRRFGAEAEIQELPRALSNKTDVLNRLKQNYVDRNDLYNRTRDHIAELRQRAIDAERERERYEGQMDAIRTQREYEALDKEINDANLREAEVRRELQREESRLDEMTVALEQEEQRIAKQDQEVAEEQQRIDTEIAERKMILEELVAEEANITPGLDEEMLFKFERIIRNKEGLGIVALRAGVCTGCQMILPPFFANRVRIGEEIMFCPNCSRIVFYGGDDEFQSDPFDVSTAEFDDDDLMFDDDDEPEEIEAAVDGAVAADAGAASTGSREQE
ncbi:MAG: C4-type zinc ribbon domain-containing protein [Spirochaetaceae bacterium]|nr:C4-type zinc ribbon domain-containing protein [Spirochaetaceae bacterium]